MDAARLHAAICGVEGARARTLRTLYERSGIERRHSVLLRSSGGALAARQEFFPRAEGPQDRGPGTRARMERYELDAPVLALRAARAALGDAGLAPGQVTHLVSASCTGFFAPGVEHELIGTLGLDGGVRRTHVGFMGCHGAFNALAVARTVVDAEPDAVVLVCAVELCSLHFAYGWDRETVVPNALFADGAGAVVCARRGGWTLAAQGSCRIPDSGEDMTWRIGDHGFRMTLSSRVPELIEREVGPWMEEWLDREGLRISDVATWAVHPGGPRILEAFESAAGLVPRDTRVSRQVLRACGNMSSATIVFILERLLRQGAPRPLVAVGFGPGLVAEAMLWR